MRFFFPRTFFRWHLTQWSECSRTCGNGTHSRLLYCRKQVNDSYYQKLEDSACDVSTKPSVSLFQRRNEVLCPAEWRPLPWSEVIKKIIIRNWIWITRLTGQNKRTIRHVDVNQRCSAEHPNLVPRLLGQRAVAGKESGVLEVLLQKSCVTGS